MLKNNKYTLILALAISTALFSCSKDEQVEEPFEAVANSVRILETDTHGKVLTDADGNSLYFFSWDSKGLSECEGECIDAWPVFYSDNLSLDSGLDMADFGLTTRTDGSMQTTYKGWPLYYFINDTAPNQINGDGANDVWFVAKPDYSVMLASAQLIGRDLDGVETAFLEDYTPGEERTFYLTDDYGNTLYRFISDTYGANNYTATDFTNNALWPIQDLVIDQVPSLFSNSDFEEINVHGSTQTTFRGWPLYTFQMDNSRGDNYGVGFPEAGIWPIANQNTDQAPE